MDINNSKTNQTTKDAPKTGNQKILSKSFTDVDNFNDFLIPRRREITQLTCGYLQAEFFLIQVGDIYFLFRQVNQGIQAFGEGWKEHISFGISCVENDEGLYSYRRFVDPQRTIFGFNGTGADLIVPKGGAMMNIAIPRKTFHAYAEQLQRYDLDDSFLSKNHVNLLPTGMKEIKGYLKQLSWLAVHQPTWLQKPHIEKLVTDDFVPLLISKIPIKLNSKSFVKPSRRAKLISQAEQQMLAHLEKPLTLKQLAQNLGSSSSALLYGFQDLFGISPMRYLKVQRLNAVREHLKAREPENCTIATLASQFGFYSPCHFTRDYKTMFGELPSETLGKKV
ncbi:MULTISPECIES: helix-turn-helix domain-containing protein [unclassified Okeania]|uniref:helix-turn-helix domain-containing protein n=1 Tax=unclassified Okeania TaxID=2634635 RepID=UPI00257D564E|nr:MULTISPECIES: helix-turn-helix domain-containing protein [unclassified Okeania]